MSLEKLSVLYLFVFKAANATKLLMRFFRI